MAAKRPADSDQCCPGPTKETRVEATPDSAATGDAADAVWGSVFSGNEVVWSSAARTWMTDVASVTLGGEVRCMFRVQPSKRVEVVLGSESQTVHFDTMPLSTSSSTTAHFALRAHLLVAQCHRLRRKGQCHTFTQVVQPATLSASDSDDEQVPDPEIPPAYTEAELSVLNHIYSKKLWPCFQEAVRHHFQNAQGKHFFTALGDFLNCVHPPDLQSCYRSTHSTNPSGEAQPGCWKLQLTELEPKRLRQQPKPVSKSQLRVADYVLYDVRNAMYCIVGEIKSDVTSATAQQLEQMVGLFRKNQKAMLGFTCNPCALVPRILTQQGGFLRLYQLEGVSLEDATSLAYFAEVFLAFASIVNIAQ